MPRDADMILMESFLETRAKLIEVAATLDRIERAGSETPLSADASGTRSLLNEALKICLSETPNRAGQLQRLFSRPYDPQWRSEMEL